MQFPAYFISLAYLVFLNNGFSSEFSPFFCHIFRVAKLGNFPSKWNFLRLLETSFQKELYR